MSLWGQRVTFEVSSASPDDTPVWVDLSRYVRHESGLEITAGRQNNLDSSEPSTLRFVLNNADGRFTFGNTASPYASWWAPGRKCRLRETYGSTVTDLFTGYLQVPEEALPDASTNSQFVNVTATDRLGRLAAAPGFVSTLAEHVRYTGTALAHYWSLADSSGATQGANIVSSSSPLSRENQVGTAPATSGVGPLLEFGVQSGPVGDDASYPKWNDAPNGYRVRLVNRALPSVVTSSSSFLVFSAWVYHPQPNEVTTQLLLRDSAIGSLAISITSQPNWQAIIANATGSVTLTGPVPKTNSWQYVAVTVDCSATGAVAMYIDANAAVTGTLASAPFVGTLNNVVIDGPTGTAAAGSVGHVQIYLGTYSSAMHSAQFQMALSGLERQTTGDRIRTIAAYAGIPTAEYNDTVDKGTAIMQTASLAGKTPLQAMREAERTEQGLLYVDGSGRLVFKDRRTLYNI